MKIEDKYNQEIFVSNLFYEIIMIISNKRMIKELRNEKLKNRIALYGIGKVGEALFRLCTVLEIEIAYAIDKKDVSEWNGLKVFHPGDDLPNVDIVIISPVEHTDEIRKFLFEQNLSTYLTASDLLTEIINYPLHMNFNKGYIDL